MPNKRSKRKKSQQFDCIYCQQRLWRLGSSKHYLFYTEASEIKQRLNISRKNASFFCLLKTRFISTLILGLKSFFVKNMARCGCWFPRRLMVNLSLLSQEVMIGTGQLEQSIQTILIPQSANLVIT